MLSCGNSSRKKHRYEFAGHVGGCSKDKVSTEETSQEIKRRYEFGTYAATTSKKTKVEASAETVKRRRTISDDSSGSEVESKPPQKRRKLAPKRKIASNRKVAPEREKPTPLDDYQFDDTAGRR